MNIEVVKAYIQNYGLNTSSRIQSQTYQRQYLMAKLHETGDYSLTEIGNMFKRHHATVIHSIRQHHNLKKDGYYLKLIKPAVDILNDCTIDYTAPKRNIFDDIEKATNLDKLRRIRRWIKEGRYELSTMETKTQ